MHIEKGPLDRLIPVSGYLLLLAFIVYLCVAVEHR
jgi:hypothetical protein